MSLFDRVLNPTQKIEVKNKSKKNTEPSIGGAVPVKNEKGDISMETVKVKRYIAGKIPEYVENNIKSTEIEIPKSQSIKIDKVLFDHGTRQIFEPQIIKTNEIIKNDNNEQIISNNRQLLKEKLLRQDIQDLTIEKINENIKEQISDDESEYTDESDEIVTRLKPIFIPKSDRINILPENHQIDPIQHSIQEHDKQRKAETIEIIGKLIQEDIYEQNTLEYEENVVITDDDDEEKAFEEWKLRELNRMKRDIEEMEAHEANKQEIQKLRLMTEEERQQHLLNNPKIITNQTIKGKYKYLQKYYHRGAYYLDVDDQVLKQDFAQPTLDDLFDKSTLPSTLQVKNFGKAGRTKYTHLVDQDTSDFIGPWSKKNEFVNKFANKHGGGMKQAFDRPGTKRKR